MANNIDIIYIYIYILETRALRARLVSFPWILESSPSSEHSNLAAMVYESNR